MSYMPPHQRRLRAEHAANDHFNAAVELVLNTASDSCEDALRLLGSAAELCGTTLLAACGHADALGLTSRGPRAPAFTSLGEFQRAVCDKWLERDRQRGAKAVATDFAEHLLGRSACWGAGLAGSETLPADAQEAAAKDLCIALAYLCTLAKVNRDDGEW